MNLRAFLTGCAIGLMIALAAASIAVMIPIANREGHRRQQPTERCHARGPAYHYWQERQRCVMYVESP